MTYKDAAAAGLLKESAVWWIKYRANGKLMRESSETEKEQEARPRGSTVSGRQRVSPTRTRHSPSQPR